MSCIPYSTYFICPHLLFAHAGLYQIVSNFAGAASALSGPVAIVAVGADAARTDIGGLFQFAALVNVNLAVVNFLPMPVRASTAGFHNAAHNL